MLSPWASVRQPHVHTQAPVRALTFFVFLREDFKEILLRVPGKLENTYLVKDQLSSCRFQFAPPHGAALIATDKLSVWMIALCKQTCCRRCCKQVPEKKALIPASG